MVIIIMKESWWEGLLLLFFLKKVFFVNFYIVNQHLDWVVLCTKGFLNKKIPASIHIFFIKGIVSKQHKAGVGYCYSFFIFYLLKLLKFSNSFFFGPILDSNPSPSQRAIFQKLILQRFCSSLLTHHSESQSRDLAQNPGGR